MHLSVYEFLWLHLQSERGLKDQIRVLGIGKVHLEANTEAMQLFVMMQS